MKSFKNSIVILIFLFSLLHSAVLEHDTFDGTLDGWSGTGLIAGTTQMTIPRDRTATKTFNLGAAFANTNVSITFQSNVPSPWETDDNFNVLVNGSVAQTYKSGGGDIDKTFTATADAAGNITVGFNPDTSANDEPAYIEDFTISANFIIPTAEYRFDDCNWDGTTNEVKDSISSVNAQSFNGADLNNTDSVLCSSGHFDGVDDYVSAGDEFNDIFGSTSDSFTITAWIKPNSYSTTTSNHGTANTIFAKAADGSNDNLEIGVNADGSLHVYIDAATNFAGDIGGGIVSNDWNFISVSYDGSTLTAIINGTKYTNTTPSGNFANASGSPFTIGTTRHSDTSFSGLIDEVKIFDVALPETVINDIYTNENALMDYKGNARTCNSCLPGYCELNNLPEGFHIIDPDGGNDSNSYEIYCDMTSAKAPRELIALPLKNDYNNFVFHKDNLDSLDYYNESDNARNNNAKNSFSFLQIDINGSNISVVPESIAEDSPNQGFFSNINLIGTPFAIDTSNTVLTNCNTNTLRVGAFDQAVKINTLNYTNARCKVTKMPLKLLSDYKYLTYPDIEGTNGGYNSEILEETCRQIFEKVPDDSSHLPTIGAGSDGYFWIDPDKSGRGQNNPDINEVFRPVVAYCKYQNDIKQAWTFVMALDGKVTNSKNDIKTMQEVRDDPSIYHDTCSQLGLLFFVPNTKDTFGRVQQYLSLNRLEWINYTGTIREKYKMYTNNPAQEYYISGEGFNEIWPYGPFGVYHPFGGNRDINNNYLAWRSSSGDTVMGNVSGRCMNSGSGSGASTCTDYTQRLAAVTNDNGTMGDVGWRTTLMDQVAAGTISGITNGDQWWVADVGAGNYLTNSTVAGNGLPEYSILAPGDGSAAAHRAAYYEPNGNYTADAWLNFISDSSGNVYHNDDNNAFYSYYDYMCMAWDNYYGFSRHGLMEGPFKVIEHNSPPVVGHTIPNDLNITTKIVNEPKDFDILLFDEARTTIVDDQNISAGVFLVAFKETISAGSDDSTDIRYYGELDSDADFNLITNPRGIIALDDPLSSIGANKELAFEFKYCRYTNSWDSCWDITGIGENKKATCKTGYDSEGRPNSPCQFANSDDFALRPKNFTITSVDGVSLGSTIAVKAKDVNISYRANDFLDNNTIGYNEFFNTLDTNVTLITTDRNCSKLTLGIDQSGYKFTDGIDTHETPLTDVGEFTFVLQEKEGFEFAKVDDDDTNWTARQIEPNGVTLTIKPDHFRISALANLNHNKVANFTYLAKTADIENMSAMLDFNVTAQNDKDNTTVNYTDECYAEDTNLDVNITASAGDANSKIYYKVATNPASDSNFSFGTGGSFIESNETVAKSIFTSDVNGSGNIVVKFNFNRNIDNANNPFSINLFNLNVSDKNIPSLIIETANQTINNNATFIYGRTHTGTQRYAGPSGPANMYYEVYCFGTDSNGVPCNTNMLTPFAPNLKRTDDTRWYINEDHNLTNNDGFVGTVKQKDGTATTGDDLVTATLPTNANPAVTTIRYDASKGYPYKTTMENNASGWLIYDETNAAAVTNKFTVEFTNIGNWSGENEASSTTNNPGTAITNRRTMW